MRAFPKLASAMLACAVMLGGLPNPSTPASPLASVASAQAPAPPTPTPATTAAAAKLPAKAAKPKPTPAPVAPALDPISKAKASLVAPATFRVGANTALDASGSVGDRLEWKITDGRPLFIGDGRRFALTFTEPDAANAAIPFAVELLAFTTTDGKPTSAVTSVDSTIVIVSPQGVVVVVPPVVEPPVVVDPTKPTDPPTPPVVAPTTAITAAVYVYEKDETAVPPAVMSGLNKINRESKGKIIATLLERDTTNHAITTPSQYVAPLAAAKAEGLPALVIMAGAKVVKVIKNPTAEAQVLEAVK